MARVLRCLVVSAVAASAAASDSAWRWPWQREATPAPIREHGEAGHLASTQAAAAENPSGSVIDVTLSSELQVAPGAVSARATGAARRFAPRAPERSAA
eukprot:CAMPEP_0176270458 /NCGR_PEP_ID=MMETSP0121_2-20121125/44708_1 /TAXON_ID=160619 /ORGANISM="Kryptoperidinium foliaceum, Strain CCMP 1326" /LENGTH=98 /DNA_ID=CAMNT_0017610599 /DNA_START=115 /DNA_END=409 /DNA_ORIENTATION=-